VKESRTEGTDTTVSPGSERDGADAGLPADAPEQDDADARWVDGSERSGIEAGLPVDQSGRDDTDALG